MPIALGAIHFIDFIIFMLKSTIHNFLPFPFPFLNARYYAHTNSGIMLDSSAKT